MKALFYPTATSEYDVYSIARQGYWGMVAIGTVRLIVSLFGRDLFSALVEPLFYFLAANGVRQGSRAASIGALISYLGSILVTIEIGTFRLGILDVLSLPDGELKP